MNNADFRAFLIAPSAAASSDDAPAPLVPQKSGDELFAEPAAEPILRDADGSRLAISASHVDATCDLVAGGSGANAGFTRGTTSGAASSR